MGKTKKKLESLVELRNRAEQKVKSDLKALHNQPFTKTQEMLHELQVYQIELEMQNEELRRAQFELEMLRQKYFDLFNLAPVGYFAFDTKGLIIEVNLTGAELLETTKSGLLMKGFSHWIDPEYQDTFYLHRKQTIETRKRQTCELKMIRSDGREFFSQLSSIVEPEEDGNFKQIRTTVIDITDRKKTEQEQLKYEAKLKSMALTLSRTQQYERQKLSTQIHDGINQRMAIIRLKLQQAIQSVSDSSLAETLNRISSDFHCIMQDSYSLMFELSNPILYELGLISAIKSLLKSKLLTDNNITSQIVTLETHIKLNQDIAVILYQAVHELLVNIIKHANATNVEVIIVKKQNSLRISINDNGLGFKYPIEKLPNRDGGFGLFQIRETLQFIGGKLSIESKHQQGAIITITAPLDYEKIS